MKEALFTTPAELMARDDNNSGVRTGDRTIEACHLHFNGPGAAGFGVKRTALLLPESVMLLVAPSCCGRHGTITGNKTGFEERMFYLQITERDLVTGKYLTRIPEAARIVAGAKPKVIFLSMTCVDALMGTDLKRIAGQIENETGIRTVGSFMDPITREGRNGPMVSVQQAIMSCLVPMDKNPHAANIIGNFVPLEKNCELYSFFKERGFTEVRQISACSTFEEYLKMAEASLNIVINPQAVAAAEDMKKKLGIPYIHIRNTFSPARTATEYEKLDWIASGKTSALETLAEFRKDYPNLRIGIGEAVNGSNLELALTLLEAGLNVRYVFKNIVTAYDREILKRISGLKPDLKIYSGVHPSVSPDKSRSDNPNGKRGDNPNDMRDRLEQIDLAIGLDAGYLSGESSSVCWNMERQTFGYTGLIALLREMRERIEKPIPHRELMHGSYLTI